jgi:predicted XRE-type DNA-binding protein
MKRSKAKSTRSSGNVFADLGVPGAGIHAIKADIVIAIAAQIKNRGLTQTQAAELIGLKQPDVSKLLRGHFEGYSLERLFGFLQAVGKDVAIRVTDSHRAKAGRLQFEIV